MVVYDFEFDGQRLSELGMTICSFGDKGLETVDNGSQVSFNTVSVLGGSLQRKTSAVYEDCLEATIQICKYSCATDVKEITPIELRQLTKWLNRKKFLKFKFLSNDYIDLYYEAKIDVSRIELDGRLYGLELNITTNRPFALKEPRKILINNAIKDGKHFINDTSHEEGYIYPHTEITLVEGGKLTIYNAIENRETIIENCVAGEVITMDYPIIKSNISSHDLNIQNDFNWKFFRIANTYNNSRNDLIISLPCIMKVEYSPIIKVGL